jgi:predicted metal-dependent hydrolase
VRIIIAGEEINFNLKRLIKSKTLRLSVKIGGKVIVTAPVFISLKQIKDFLLQNSSWILGRLHFFKERHDKSVLRGSHKDYLLNKSRALRLVRKKIEKLNQIYKFKFNKVTIRNQHSRWGSCSKHGNLNFNFKLVYLPDELSTYVVAHELCHLKEMNHSSRFWRLVEITISDYREVRKQLKNIY